MPTLQLFIDTNVLLSFYHLSNEDLEELRKLVALVNHGEVTLHLPQQVVDEFKRNRGNKIADGLRIFKQHSFKLQVPQICKDYTDYPKLRQLVRDLETVRASLLDLVEHDVREQSLKADEIVNSLFAVSSLYPVTDALLAAAKRRHALGNPPGKRDSLGDAVNWEALLLHVPNDHDLYFVAGDQDYASLLDRSRFNEFLTQEWRDSKRSTLIFFQQLTSFLSENYPSIVLASDVEKDRTISKFAASRSFASTHACVAHLSKYSEFSDVQANAIVSAALQNNQINWIISDDDVGSFLKGVVAKARDRIDPSNLAELEKALLPRETPEDEGVNEDVPF